MLSHFFPRSIDVLGCDKIMLNRTKNGCSFVWLNFKFWISKIQEYRNEIKYKASAKELFVRMHKLLKKWKNSFYESNIGSHTPFSPFNALSCLGFTSHNIIEFGTSKTKEGSDFDSSRSPLLSGSSMSSLWKKGKKKNITQCRKVYLLTNFR